MAETEVLPPAAAPCKSCPYRRDVPSGVWDEEEYAKLSRYDEDTAFQPVGVFLCHQQDGRVCAGWAGCHDHEHSLALRIATASGHVSPEVADAIIDYESPVPLFASGAEAAAHGRRAVCAPGADAVRVIDRLSRSRARR